MIHKNTLQRLHLFHTFKIYYHYILWLLYDSFLLPKPRFKELKHATLAKATSVTSAMLATRHPQNPEEFFSDEMLLDATIVESRPAVPPSPGLGPQQAPKTKKTRKKKKQRPEEVNQAVAPVPPTGGLVRSRLQEKYALKESNESGLVRGSLKAAIGHVNKNTLFNNDNDDVPALGTSHTEESGRESHVKVGSQGEEVSESPGKSAERALRQAERDIRARDEQVLLLRERSQKLQGSLEKEKKARVALEYALEAQGMKNDQPEETDGRREASSSLSSGSFSASELVSFSSALESSQERLLKQQKKMASLEAECTELRRVAKVGEVGVIELREALRLLGVSRESDRRELKVLRAELRRLKAEGGVNTGTEEPSAWEDVRRLGGLLEEEKERNLDLNRRLEMALRGGVEMASAAGLLAEAEGRRAQAEAKEKLACGEKERLQGILQARDGELMRLEKILGERQAISGSLEEELISVKVELNESHDTQVEMRELINEAQKRLEDLELELRAATTAKEQYKARVSEERRKSKDLCMRLSAAMPGRPEEGRAHVSGVPAAQAGAAVA